MNRPNQPPWFYFRKALTGPGRQARIQASGKPGGGERPQSDCMKQVIFRPSVFAGSGQQSRLNFHPACAGGFLFYYDRSNS